MDTFEQWWNDIRYGINLQPAVQMLETWLGSNRFGQALASIALIAIAAIAISFLRRRILRNLLLRPEWAFWRCGRW
jgi:hypothetical protein